MKRLAYLLLIAGCASAPSSAREASLDWLTGCWENADGSYREIWSPSEQGYYFGYAVSLKDGVVSFFEQTRIDSGQPAVFNAYPAGKGPSPFPEISRTDASISFAEPAHDYPQLIVYRKTETGLSALISLEDGSNAQDFDFVPCPIPR